MKNINEFNKYKSNSTFNWQRVDGIRVVVAAFGILCGLTGIIAGYFEILQGNTAPTGIVISTIGPNYSMADDFTYFAVTIIPNLLITGMVAIVISCLVIIWSVGFVHKKNGSLILLGLSFAQILVGGGWVIDLVLMTCILASRISKPLNWWRSHLPAKLIFWLTKLLPLNLGVYAIISCIMLALSILGIDNGTLLEPLIVLAIAMFIPIILMILGGIAHEIQRKHGNDLEFDKPEPRISKIG